MRNAVKRVWTLVSLYLSILVKRAAAKSTLETSLVAGVRFRVTVTVTDSFGGERWFWACMDRDIIGAPREAYSCVKKASRN